MDQTLIFTKEQYKQFYNNFFILDDELDQLISIYKNYPHHQILITGIAGCGKTTLLKMFEEKIRVEGANVCFIHGYNFENEVNRIKSSKIDLKNAIVLIDGIDENQNPDYILSQLRLFDRVCITSRNANFNYKFTNVIRIGRLSKNQCKKLIDGYIGPLKPSKGLFDILLNIASPLPIRMILQSLNEYLNSNDLIRELILELGNEVTQEYKLGQGLYLQSSKLLVPESKEIIVPDPIIDDISIVNTSLLTQVAKNPSLVHQCSSRQFEELVCELLDKKGYKVRLTGQTRDGGKDIIIVENNLLGSFLIYVECKQYAPDRPVGVNLVRELYGTISADEATAGLLITSSYFSKDAINFKNKVKHRLSLMDYVQLISEIQKLS